MFDLEEIRQNIIAHIQNNPGMKTDKVKLLYIWLHEWAHSDGTKTSRWFARYTVPERKDGQARYSIEEYDYPLS